MADLEFRGISKSFGGIVALNDVSFSCKRGEVHALLGENGAGKSTLLKVLSGAHRADAGEIRVDGQPVSIHSPRDAMELGIGTVYQELSLIPELTVSENIFLGRIPTNVLRMHRRPQLRAMTQELLDRYGVDDIRPDTKAKDLSLSRRQIVEILRVLATDPSVIVLDEATSALTENRVAWLLGLARRLADEGKVVIFISHRMSEIRNACDRVTILRNGSTVDTRRLQDLEMDEIVSMMIGRQMSSYFPEKRSAATAEVVLGVRDLRYEHTLNGVEFDLHHGEVLGIGGLAGQGQAELLRALYGVIPAHGSITLKGSPIRNRDAREALRRGMALVPEERATQGLLLDFSVPFNTSLASLGDLKRGPLLNLSRERELTQSFIVQLAIKTAGDTQPASALSGGNQQKVVLAKMLATGPEVLMLHDITRGVDVGTKKEMFSLVREIASKGNAVLYLSTDVEELVNVCDRVLVMHDGRVAADLSGADLTADRIIGASIGAHVEQ